MAYTKTTWKDRLVETPNKYEKSGETETEVTLTPEPGTVTEEGTPISAANMNKIEQGIYDAAATADAALPKDGSEAMTGDLEINANNAHIEATSGTALYIASKANALLLSNCYYDGTNYMRYNTDAGAAMLFPNFITRKLVFRYALPGANPIVWVDTEGWNTDNLPNPAKTDAANTFTQIQEISKSDNENYALTVKNLGGSGQGLNVKAGSSGIIMLLEDNPGNERFKVRSDGESELNGKLTLKHASVPMVFDEAPHTGSLGLWRFVVDADTFRLDKNTSAGRDFATYVSPFNIHNTGNMNTRNLTINGNKAWHVGDLRWQTDHLEYNDGGVWKAVGGVKSVQRGTVAVTGTSTTNVAVSSVNTAKSQLHIINVYSEWKGDEGNNGKVDIRGRLSSGTNIEIVHVTTDNVTTNPEVTVSWELVEHY